MTFSAATCQRSRQLSFSVGCLLTQMSSTTGPRAVLMRTNRSGGLSAHRCERQFQMSLQSTKEAPVCHCQKTN